MLLSADDAELFFKLNRCLMHFVNQRLGVVREVASPEEFSALSPETRVEVRDAFLDRIDLIEAYAKENPANLSDEDMEIVLSWREQVSGTFYAFRQLKNHMVFLSSKDPPVAYGVVALTDPFEGLFGPRLPIMTKTVLLPFKDKIVYDGLLSGYNISFGGGIKRMLNDSYRRAKQHQGIVTSLPVKSFLISAAAATTKKKQAPKKKRKPQKATNSDSTDVKLVLEAIAGMTGEFSRQHLNEEYAVLCRKLAEKLSRKRPSPLLRGQPKTWACGILRTIGWVNFLDDRDSKPHMKLTAIDKALGVSSSTGQQKSKEIRKLLKIREFDMDWTLPSRRDDNPMGWMIEVNGFVMDVRRAPREIQEMAFEKGLIPYIPGDFDDNRNTEVIRG